MALQKSYTDLQDHTDTSSYHKIARINIDYIRSVAEIIVLTYKDSTAKSAGKLQTAVRTYNVSGGTFTSVFGATAQDTVNKNPQESAYIHLKTLGDFTSATDV